VFGENPLLECMREGFEAVSGNKGNVSGFREDVTVYSTCGGSLEKVSGYNCIRIKEILSENLIVGNFYIVVSSS